MESTHNDEIKWQINLNQLNIFNSDMYNTYTELKFILFYFSNLTLQIKYGVQYIIIHLYFKVFRVVFEQMSLEIKV